MTGRAEEDWRRSAFGSFLALRKEQKSINNPINQPVLERLLRAQELVTLGIQFHLFQFLATVLCDQFIQHVLHAYDVFCMDRNVRRLALRASQRLVDHDFAMLECEALALGSS